MTSLTRPDDDTLYQALIDRNPDHDGRIFVGVTTTGIFCRLSCSARKPLRENCRFFEGADACIDAGFRPCQRCHPLRSGGDPVVTALMAALDADPGRRWREEDLIAMGHDPSTVRRLFRRHTGRTFLDFARLTRVSAGAATLAGQIDRRHNGGAKVIDAQLDAGFDSASGFRAAFARILGRPPASFARDDSRDDRLCAEWIATPIGAMVAVGDGEALHLLDFFDHHTLAADLKRVEARTGKKLGVGRGAATASIARELGEFFAGTSHAFTTPIATGGTEFERTVWAALRAIPPGETRSYLDLAAAIGRPTAMRAVARANGANRLAIVIPCHRVIGADGTLTGYAGGLWRKQWLIDHEARIGRGVSKRA